MTMVLDPMMDAAPDEMAPDAEMMPSESDMSQGYCIEVCALPDGSFSVSGPEPLQAEAEAETGEPGSEIGQSAASIGEALKLVLAIYKETESAGGGSPDDQMAAGFNRARGGLE